MWRKVNSYIRAHRLISPGDTVIVAVSGGADSVALLDVLAGLRSSKLRLIVAHLNHCLRGSESDADEAFVRKLAGGYGVCFVTKAVDVLALSRESKMSLEEAGRVARYRFLKELAINCNARSVAVAHHADDQAETVLMRLIRGAGGSGLRAMTSTTAGLIIRPLLSVTRREIESYLDKKGLGYRTDSSNADLNFLRNRIRHELIPFLRGYNPAITERLATTAVALSEDEKILEAVTATAFANHALVGSGEVSISVAGADMEPRGIRIRMYRQALQQLKGDLSTISAVHLNDVDLLLLSRKPSGKVNLSRGITVMRRYEKLVFSSENYTPPEQYELHVEGPGSYAIPCGGSFTVEFAQAPGTWENISAHVVYLDMDTVPFPWQIRTFRPGDAFSPLGMAGSKKVKNLFIDRKVPLLSRRRIPLFFSGDTLFWVGGVMPSASGRITADTTSVLKLEIVDSTA
ncbi:tRNA(Ile) (cytidine34-C2)--(L-lysine-6-N) ligase, putative [Geotalea daltonii FRC-32]|uniref:tRNA(Ile)-lysidine synthase n=1 Tax=Geotalea daltonii (strain DSM 22248 / JCM 15807 / FRC-32) TaxID=316067 RepID=B9M5K8_GEODF|nr:tRNA lysidine(34) synthetase TilS [Geotalea daltonii]ACM21767.1 tRNA(Ile) (cytidine34-C2)--(L-lysine-6-N) ligase, putative [Geotalea daltonii FRC-32]